MTSGSRQNAARQQNVAETMPCMALLVSTIGEYAAVRYLAEEVAISLGTVTTKAQLSLEIELIPLANLNTQSAARTLQP